MPILVVLEQTGVYWKPLENMAKLVHSLAPMNEPVSEIPLARCCTVWTDQSDSSDYLLVCDQILWFGTRLPHSLINLNQLQAYGLYVNDDPFDNTCEFGIEHDDIFIPFDTTGTVVVHFKTRVPTIWESTHLPVVLLTGEEWNPSKEVLRPSRLTKEDAEMRSIKSLMMWQVDGKTHGEETDAELGKISCVYDEKEFRDGLVSAVQIAMMYQEDVNEIEYKWKVHGVITNDRHSKVTPKELSHKWNIGLQTAKDTLRVTTQKGIHTVIHPMTWRVRVNHLHLHRQRLRGTWYTDTLLSKVKLKLRNKCTNVYTQGKFTRAIPMTSHKDAGKSLIEFTDNVGIPEWLVTDGTTTEFTGRHTEFVKEARHMRIMLHTTEQGRKNQNHAAKREIGFLSKRWKLRMTKKSVPKHLWDFGLVYESELLSHMARGDDRRTGYEVVTGQTPDISEWLDFKFYDLVWWLERSEKPNVTDQTQCLAWWLGVSHRVGSDLCYWLITESGKIIAKTSVEHVTRDDYLQTNKKAKSDAFNQRLEEPLDNANFVIDGEGEFDSMYLDDIEDDENHGVTYANDINTPTAKEYNNMVTPERPEDDDEEAIDKYLNVELIMNTGTNDKRRGRVI
jgi:hypothetical protein